jgi:hypothetical protein
VKIADPKSIEEAIEEGTWAITIGPNSKYIGQLWAIDGEFSSDKAYFVAHLTNPIIVRYPLLLGWRSEGGPPSLDPVGHCTDIERFQLYTTPLDFIFFSDMSTADRKYYKARVQRVIKTTRLEHQPPIPATIQALIDPPARD